MIDQTISKDATPSIEEPANGLGKEIKALLILGVPMGLTQLVQFSVQTIDILMIGRLGAEALAAAALANVLFFIIFMLGFGPVMAVGPLVSQALGADKNNIEDVNRSVRMGMWAVVLPFPLCLLYCLFAGQLALALGQPADLVAMASPYVLALAPSLPFMMGVFILRGFLAAINRTRVPLLAGALSTLVNALFNYLLIFGELGFPRLELVGAGIASVIAHGAGFIFLLGYCYLDPVARKFRLLKDALKPDWTRLKDIFDLGWPMGASMAFEAMFFNSGVFLMGLIGKAEVAAFQVGLNVAALAFMMPLGLSMAGGVRVGLAAGARDAEGVRHAARATILVCAAAILVVAVPVMLAPGLVAAFYLDTREPANWAVVALIETFLPIAAAFMLFDAIQVGANQALRGLKDVRVPLLIAGLCYWAVGFPVAAWLSQFTPVGAIGVWFGFLVSLALAALLLSVRLMRLVRPPAHRAAPAG